MTMPTPLPASAPTAPQAGGDRPPLLEARNISKYFGAVVALEGVSLEVRAGEINCLLGDNGAGKSTLIKTLSGVHAPDDGTLAVDGTPVRFNAPRDALDAGIATVYQDLSVMPLMSISRNFFLGNEPTKGVGPFKWFDSDKAAQVARDEMHNIGIDVRDTDQLVGTLSGGERQTLAIARAEYFGARVLILDEPTSALGVKESAIVLRHAISARNRGLGVIFITHNVQHALPIGDSFTILTRGRSGGTYKRGELNANELHRLMGGGSSSRSSRPTSRCWPGVRPRARPPRPSPSGRTRSPSSRRSARTGTPELAGDGHDDRRRRPAGARLDRHGQPRPGRPRARAARDPRADPGRGPGPRLPAVGRRPLAQAAHDPDARPDRHRHREPVLPGARAGGRGRRPGGGLRDPAVQRQ